MKVGKYKITRDKKGSGIVVEKKTPIKINENTKEENKGKTKWSTFGFYTDLEAALKKVYTDMVVTKSKGVNKFRELTKIFIACKNEILITLEKSKKKRKAKTQKEK